MLSSEDRYVLGPLANKFSILLNPLHIQTLYYWVLGFRLDFTCQRWTICHPPMLYFWFCQNLWGSRAIYFYYFSTFFLNLLTCCLETQLVPKNNSMYRGAKIPEQTAGLHVQTKDYSWNCCFFLPTYSSTTPGMLILFSMVIARLAGNSELQLSGFCLDLAFKSPHAHQPCWGHWHCLPSSPCVAFHLHFTSKRLTTSTETIDTYYFWRSNVFVILCHCSYLKCNQAHHLTFNY
jgi:hypothetical protein